MTTGTALVLGATGGAGSETALALHRRAWRVRALSRDAARAAVQQPAFEWVQGDAMNAADVLAAAQGVDIIVHAVNPPNYRNWRGLALPMIDNTIAAAEATGARIVFPGTIYNYGPGELAVMREDSPQRPRTRKGKIRVEMETRLERSSASVLIVRAGDFFGPRAGNSWFSQGLVKPNAPLKSVTYPGAPGVGHAWAYLPDLAATIALLAGRRAELGKFERFHFGGHWFDDGRDIAQHIRNVAGNPRLPIRRFPWTPLCALSPFVRLFREMAEMRYLWEKPGKLDNTRLVTFLGAEPHTPIAEALAVTLTALGCEVESKKQRRRPYWLDNQRAVA